MSVDITIEITAKRQTHLIEWLRFIQESRPKAKFQKGTRCVFDLRNASFLWPHHLCAIACLAEEYQLFGATIKFKYKMRSKTGSFIYFIKFDKYWNKHFNKDSCFLSLRKDVMPIWQLNPEKIDSYSDLAAGFYNNHSLSGKDLTILRSSVVEALNNINDHSESKVKGFIFTMYYKNTSKLEIAICDFGVGISTKVNNYLRSIGEPELSHPQALQKAFELNFTTKSRPNNAGKGLDMILSQVKTTDGEIQVVTNKAFYSNKIHDSRPLQTMNDQLNLSFDGTCIIIELNTNNFLPLEQEITEELDLF